MSEQLIRKRDKPFTNKEQENVLVWIYDNNKQNSEINKINLKVQFEEELDLNKLIAYPEKFLIVKISKI